MIGGLSLSQPQISKTQVWLFIQVVIWIQDRMPQRQTIIFSKVPGRDSSNAFEFLVFCVKQASDVMETYPEIENWVTAGHSLGWSLAARFAYRHQGELKAFILWVANPAATDDHSNAEMFSRSIFGTSDILTTAQDIDESRHLLPENAN